MPLTATDLQRLIVLEVGDTSGLILAQNIVLIWVRYADKALIAPRIQELYTKRACIDIVLATLREAVDFNAQGDLDVKLHQKTVHLQTMRVATQAEITLIEARARTARPGVIGTLMHVTPSAPPSIQPVPVSPYLDSNDPAYTGDPYVSRLPRY